ncbi:MAG: thioredoxin [Bifidobacteriaceae bacterium]|jgi:thioredoxin 1|nr:thioredoxin [Bifidobacteriaceae bacterium]
MSSLTPVTDQTFAAEVLESSKPVLVDFWAPWCGPCRQLTPVVEQIAAEHGEKLTVVALNTDENQATAQQYGIVSIPTLNVFSGGQLVKTIVGAKPKHLLLAELADYIA